MTTVAISGYYGFKNTGDELVLYSILQSLKSLDPGLEAVVFSNDPQATAKSYHVRAVNRWRLRQIWRELKGSDLLISGGGSLLQDVTGWKSVLYYLGVVKLAQLRHKPVMIYAQGVGPLSRALSRKLVGLVADTVNYIGVRDEMSARLLRETGVKKPPLEITADPVFGLKPQKMDLPDGKKLLQAAGADIHKPLIAMTVREWQGLEEFKKAFAKSAEILMERGYRVVFWPLHFPEDVAVSREIARRMKHQPVVLMQQYAANEMLAMAGEFHLVAGMRLHGLIMAAIWGIPFVAVSYDPKVEALTKITEQVFAGKVETISADKLLKGIDEALQKKESLREKLEISTAQLHSLARDQAMKALELAIKIK